MARIARLLSMPLFIGVLGFYAWQFRPPASRANDGAGPPQPEALRQLLLVQKAQMERLSSDPESKELAAPMSEALGALSAAMGAPSAAGPAPKAAAAPAGALFRREAALSDTNSLKVAVRTTSSSVPPSRPGRAVLSDGVHRYEIVSPAPAPRPGWTPPPRPAWSPLEEIRDPLSRRRWAYGMLLGTVAAGAAACAWARRRLLKPS